MQSSNHAIKGIRWEYFLILAVLTIFGAYLGKLPSGMVGGFAITMALGFLFDYLGDRTPVIKDFLGGGPLVCIFLSAYLVYAGVMPQGTKEVIDGFMKGGGFLTFYIASLICGSILGIESRLLVKAGARYAVPLLLGLLGASLFVAIAAAIIGPGWKEGVAYVAFPIMGGGLGAGVLPMAEIFSSISQMDSTEILSILIPAMALGNVFAIIGGAVLNKIGEIKPGLTGNGKLLKNDQQMDTKQDKKELSFKALGVGLFVSCVFLIFGRILSKFIPGIHYYALMIISVALCKVFNLIPKDIEDACSVWFQFVAKYMTAPLLVGVGVTYTDLGVVIDALTIQNIILVIAVVAGAIVGAGFGGKMVGFFFVESALSAGLCMANMGGTGDVAVLSAAKRMELIPFAQISSRLGGALMLILAGVIMPLLM